MKFNEWFELKKERCEVYGNGDDYDVDIEIRRMCQRAYNAGFKEGYLRGENNDLPDFDMYED